MGKCEGPSQELWRAIQARPPLSLYLRVIVTYNGEIRKIRMDEIEKPTQQKKKEKKRGAEERVEKGKEKHSMKCWGRTKGQRVIVNYVRKN